jgi:outer membrane protein assembly factor BamD
LSSARRRGSAATLALWLALGGAGAALPGCAAKRRVAPPPPEQVYALAMQKMEKKKYFAGRTLLQELLPRIPPDDRDLLPRVQLAIADSFYKDRGFLNYGEALNGYRNFLTYFPDHPEADRAQFMVGMSLFQQALSPDRDQALTLKAIEEFREVVTNHAGSPFVEQSQQAIRRCQERLAEHERLIGWFYHRRKAWLAAIDRYRDVLEKYPAYGRTDRVLFDLGQCLLAVGRRPEAEEAFTRLQQGDPDGPLASKAKDLLAEYDRSQGRERKDPKG